MYPIDATKERMTAVDMLGIPGLFTTLRVNRATVPKGMYAYDMQTSEEDWNHPCLIARHITVEHYGTVLTASPIELPEGGYRDLTPTDFSMGTGRELLTTEEFERKYLPPRQSATRSRHKPSAMAHVR